jgi:hypothetical protein
VTYLTAFSVLMLQISGSGGSPLVADARPGLLSSSYFSVDFLVQAGIVWGALIAVYVAIFAFRRRGKHEKQGFSDIYQKELDAIRKGGKD